MEYVCLKSAQVIITDNDLAKKYEKLGDKYFNFLPPIGVMAAISAYNDHSGWIQAVREYIFENASLVESLLKEVPEMEYTKPEGTYLA